MASRTPPTIHPKVVTCGRWLEKKERCTVGTDARPYYCAYKHSNITNKKTLDASFVSNHNWRDVNFGWQLNEGLHLSTKLERSDNLPDGTPDFVGKFEADLNDKFLNPAWLLENIICLGDPKMPWVLKSGQKPNEPDPVILICSAFASRRDGEDPIDILISDTTHTGFYSCIDSTSDMLEASYMLCGKPFIYAESTDIVPFHVYGSVGIVLDIDGFGYVYQSFRGITNMKLKTIETPPDGIDYTVGGILFQDWKDRVTDESNVDSNDVLIQKSKTKIQEFLSEHPNQIIKPGDTIEISPTRSGFRTSGSSDYQNNIVLNFNLTQAEIVRVLATD